MKLSDRATTTVFSCVCKITLTGNILILYYCSLEVLLIIVFMFIEQKYYYKQYNIFSPLIGTKYIVWGCCTQDNDTEKSCINEKNIKCILCCKHHHYACVSATESPNKSGAGKSWKRPTCLSCAPKTHMKDYTLIRNVSMHRGNKRAAFGSPSPPPMVNNKDEFRTIIK